MESLYRNTLMGKALRESMAEAGLDEKETDLIWKEFDESFNAAIENELLPQPSAIRAKLQGTIHWHKCVEDVWTFHFGDVQFRPTDVRHMRHPPLQIPSLLIVATNPPKKPKKRKR